MPRALKLNYHEQVMKKGAVALWGPDADQYEEPDWEVLELREKALQGLREAHYEEES